ncbi:MAG: 3-hydroxyacyl-CoA dehydrogenase [Candidatus Obscuribacterales bacterium]|nr:3-hydroxyacyl-CoA dehydrogenase [Candidatus Obscuribacterales bacterium]
MEVERVAVVGAGTMGASITVSLVSHGYPVLLKEANDELLKVGMANIERIQKKRAIKGVEPGTIEKENALLTGTTSFEDFADIDLAIEAVPEKLAIKKEVFEALDEFTNLNAILATNTSSLSITQIGAFTRRPDKVVGLHFFNPAHLMKLVEVIPGLETSEDTVETALNLGRSCDKLSIRVEECPSFLVNRLLGRYMNESLFCLQSGLADIETIDAVASDFVVPIGPLALRDMNGADIGLAVADYNFQGYGARYEIPSILKKMVEMNLLGRKTGQGFYIYDSETRKISGINPKIDSLVKSASSSKAKKLDPLILFLPMINEAFLVMQERICSPLDLDPAMKAGLGMRKGPLAIAEEIGLSECLKLTQKYCDHSPERFRPAPLLKRFVYAGRSTIF